MSDNKGAALRRVTGIVSLALVASGCGFGERLNDAIHNVSQYRRPELFNPVAERRRQILAELATPSATASATGAGKTPSAVPTAATAQAKASATKSRVDLIGPTRGISRKDTYEILVGDDCDVGQPLVVLSPSGSEKSRKREGRWTTISIDGAKIAEGVRGLEVMASSCTSGREPRREVYPVGVEFDRLTTSFNMWSSEDTAEEFGRIFASTFYACDVVFENRNASPVLVYGGSLAVGVRFLAAKQDVVDQYGEVVVQNPKVLFDTATAITNVGPSENAKKLSEVLNFQEKYRPLAFSDILAIFQYQQESDPRKRFIELLKSTGEILTGVSVFVSAVDWSKGVGFFTGIVTPELEKQLLWDVVLHLKSLQERSLKEVEEIAPNSQVRRVVFFPRRPIIGISPNFPLYIVEIRPEEVGVSAALIEKQAPIPASPASPSK